MVTDLNGEQRRVQIEPPSKDSNYTTYYLDGVKKAIKIEVFVLKDYLKERFGIEFRPRTSEAIV